MKRPIVVIKLGSSSLIKDGYIDADFIHKLANIVDRVSASHNTIIVSSGAVAIGRARYGDTKLEKQAASSLGQPYLMQEYQRVFEQHKRFVAQVLITRKDIMNKEGYLNARSAFISLLSNNIVPIVNENDTVAIDELKFGDNDTLSAYVASMMDAQKLIIVTDIDGLYDDNPHKNPMAKIIPVVKDISSVERYAGGAGSSVGTGGMRTKIEAAKICANSGVEMSIFSKSNFLGINTDSLKCEVGTVFIPAVTTLEHRKKIIAYAKNIAGIIYIDEGAYSALVHKGSSLLAVGIKDVKGEFSRGDSVSVLCGDKEVARGLVSFDNAEIAKIKGVKTSQIIQILGYDSADEVIHRDNLVLL